jgi:hypothetical protein
MVLLLELATSFAMFALYQGIALAMPLAPQTQARL